MCKIRFKGLHFKMLMKIAEQEYQYWETVNANKKEKQCFNSRNACRIGILSETAAKAHLLSKYNEELVNITSYGITERLKEKHFRMKPDILLETYTKEYKIEVKGITKNQPKGQILEYHANKYLKNGFTHVVFCEIDYKINEETLEGYADCDIYLIDQTKKIVEYPIAKNKFGKDCFTHPKFIYMVKSH